MRLRCRTASGSLLSLRCANFDLHLKGRLRGSVVGDNGMANRHRGEISAVLDGRERTLCLTLGALAELEAAFGADDLVALASRFESGRLSARDIARIIGCGLRGRRRADQRR